MSEAIQQVTPRHEASAICLETALNDLTGAASLSALVLSAIANDATQAESQAHTEGLRWLSVRLGAAAENLLALHDERSTRFNTMADAEEVIGELRKVRRLVMAKEAAR